MNKLTNSEIVSLCTQRMNALNKYFTTKTEVPVAGDAMKTAALVAVFQAGIDTRSQVDITHAAYREALAARDAAETQRLVTDEALKGWVLQSYGPDSATSHEFGYAPRKVGKVSAKTRAKAVELGQATREARGTKGKNQKKDIKGTLPADTTPAPAPSPVATPPAAPVAQAPVTVAAAGGGALNGAAHA